MVRSICRFSLALHSWRCSNHHATYNGLCNENMASSVYVTVCIYVYMYTRTCMCMCICIYMSTYRSYFVRAYRGSEEHKLSKRPSSRLLCYDSRHIKDGIGYCLVVWSKGPRKTCQGLQLPSNLMLSIIISLGRVIVQASSYCYYSHHRYYYYYDFVFCGTAVAGE